MDLGDTLRPWGAYPFPSDAPYVIEVGPLRIWVKVVAGDFWVGCEHAEAGTNSRAPEEGRVEPADDLEWTRYPLESEFESLRVSPVFPDRPVVVETEAHLVLKPGASALIFVRCPLWVAIELTGVKAQHLVDLPTAILSDTWFGSYTEGDLCYWISSSAAKKIHPDLSRPFLAICPVRIMNESDEDLIVEKLCLRVEALSIFESDRQLWSDELILRHLGSREPAKIEATGHPIVEVGSARFVCAARHRRSTLTAKAIDTLKGLSGVGFQIKGGG